MREAKLVVVSTALLAAMACASVSRQFIAQARLSHSGVTPAGSTRAVQDLGQELRQLFGDQAAANTVWGVHVRSLDRNETLYALNDQTPLIPASTVKVLTLAAAADLLGWDHRYQTELLTTAAIEGGTLGGDLVVRGTGDPTIHAPDGPAPDLFSVWAAELSRHGIQQVDGRLIGDDDALDGGQVEPWAGLGAGWAWNDLVFGFAAPGGALQYRAGVVELTVQPGSRPGAAVTAQIDDPASGLQLLNRMVTGERESESTFTLRRLPGQEILVLGGSVPAGTLPLRRLVSVNNPTAYFVNAFRQALEVNGITVSGNAVDVDDLPRDAIAALRRDPERLAVHYSPPLSELAIDMMKESRNLYAETILQTLGARFGKGAAEAGPDVIGDLLESWNVEPDQFTIADGSGLSRYNLVTAAALVAVLAQMQRNPRDATLFQATLPTAGEDGTLGSRMVGTAAEGNARAKTGSMTSVRTLAGYVDTPAGERLAFAIMANNFQAPRAQILGIIDRAVAAMAASSR